MHISTRSVSHLKKTIRAAMLLGLLLATVPTWAGSVDVTAGDGGIVTYGTKKHPGPVGGRGIDITGLSTGANILPILMGRLSFRSGSFEDSKNGDLFFGPGGRFSITGCVDLGNDHDKRCDKKDFNGVLITGRFLNAEVIEKNGKFFLEALLLENINPKLAARLKLTRTTYRADLQLELVRMGISRWAFRNGVDGGFLNTLPEPSSILLMGPALAGLWAMGLISRRQCKRYSAKSPR
jgi:hypothetical protein